MKIAYFDCPSGISGNMILGALIDAGLDRTYLKKELNKLRVACLPAGTAHYALRITKIKKHNISGTCFNVKAKETKKPRSIKDILSIINKSKLNKKVKSLSSKIFRRLAEAEAKVHGIPINKVHFHEVGAVDSIIDIVGAVIGIDHLGIEEIYCSNINTGSGQVKTAHGTLPVPTPATLELLKGIPIYDSGIKKELTTPTGAAIISTLAKGFGPLLKIEVLTIGYGAGSYNLKKQPNLLRIIIGEKVLQTEKDSILQLEANIDDLNPKFYDKAIAAVMKAGALDVYIVPIRMKKKRNAIQLIALCDPKYKDKILDSVFSFTTTFGVRTFLVKRDKLKKKMLKTKYGRVKIGSLEGKVKTLAIEPDDYLAKKHKVPTSRIYKDLLSI